MEDKQSITRLFNSYLKGQCSSEEISTLMKYFGTADEDFLRELVYQEYERENPEEHFAEVAPYVYDGIRTRIRPKKKLVLWPRIAIAAAVATVVFGAGLLYFNNNNGTDQGKLTYQNDVAPGKKGATLVLANGKKIDLTSSANAELANEAGVSITKTADGMLVYKVKNQDQESANKINTLTTANGQTYQVKLPDGSLVWLNAESSISYPSSFAGLKERAVQLKGEAYWEVAKDRARPFIVRTDRQDLQVLGTHFNVSAYDGEPVKTALAEGSVKVSVGSKTKMIVPGEQTVVVGNNINSEKADLDEVLAWKDGNFNFNSEPISNIMTILSRWYDIKVDYPSDFRDSRFTGSISRFRNISQVLKMLEQTEVVHFKIEGRRVSVIQ